MLDVLYVALTLVVFALLALLVGLLDRHLGGGGPRSDESAAAVRTPVAGTGQEVR